MPRLLLVEDDPALNRALEELLKEEHYDFTVSFTGDEALYLATSGSYDLLILDIMLPNMNGFAITDELRRQKIRTPILMLTAKDRVEDRVKGLEVGADDYLVKPFATTELLARIRALLRRSSVDFSDPDVLQYGNVSFRVSTRELLIADSQTVLSPKEAVLLEMFLRYPGVVLTRSQLIDRLWGYDSDVLENTLEVHVSKLRKRLEQDGCPTIQTVRGLGYRLEKAS